MSYDPENIFAKILRGELPRVAVYEDQQTLAFMDIVPSIEGHTLVVSKQPAETIFDLSPDGAASLIKTTQKVAKAVKAATECSGIMLMQLNGIAAGQSIPHIHFHILPRENGIDLKPHGEKIVNVENLEHIAERIRAALKSSDDFSIHRLRV